VCTIIFLQKIEEWRAELAASIQGGLEESDEDEEWEQEQQRLITSITKKRQSTEWKQQLVKRTRRSRD
jgi:hypothetical protein